MRTLNGLVAAALLVSLTVPAFADNPKNPTDLKNHPRVNQVNKRIANQHNRIKNGVKNGTLSHQQAAQLHGERKQIKQEEHTMRKDDKGHLTKADHKALNQQLNKRSKQIMDEKHDK